MTKRNSQSDARTRLIETAERLFYAEGIRAVGIDRIIDEANVAKMTLYNHFKSKDDLVLAVLQYRDEQVNAQFEEAIGRHQANGSQPLDAFFLALSEWLNSPGFRGCSFINAAVELADSHHPGAKFAAQHKRAFREMLQRLIADAAGEKAAQMTAAISLLVEGAIVTTAVESASDAAEVAHQAAKDLLARSSRSKAEPAKTGHLKRKRVKAKG